MNQNYDEIKNFLENQQLKITEFHQEIEPIINMLEKLQKEAFQGNIEDHEELEKIIQHLKLHSKKVTELFFPSYFGTATRSRYPEIFEKLPKPK